MLNHNFKEALKKWKQYKNNVHIYIFFVTVIQMSQEFGHNKSRKSAEFFRILSRVRKYKEKINKTNKTQLASEASSFTRQLWRFIFPALFSNNSSHWTTGLLVQSQNLALQNSDKKKKNNLASQKSEKTFSTNFVPKNCNARKLKNYHTKQLCGFSTTTVTLCSSAKKKKIEGVYLDWRWRNIKSTKVTAAELQATTRHSCWCQSYRATLFP